MESFWLSIRANTALTAFGNGMSGAILMVFLAAHLAPKDLTFPIFALVIGLSIGGSVLSERVDRQHKALIAANTELIRAAATAAIAVSGMFAGRTAGTLGGETNLSAGLSLSVLTIAFFINGLMSGVYHPALNTIWSAITEDTDTRRKVFATNALLNRIGLACGGGIGGVLVALELYQVGLWIDTATFLISALFWYVFAHRHGHDARFGHINSTPAEAGSWLDQFRIWSTFRQSWLVIKLVPWLAVYFLISAVLAIPVQILVTVSPPVLLATMTPLQMGLWSALPSWLLLAGNIVARLSPALRLPGLVEAISEACLHAAIVLGAISGLGWFALIAQSAGRLGSAVAGPAFDAWIGEAFSPEQRGRAYGMIFASTSLLSPLGIAVSYPLLSVFEGAHILYVVGGCCVAGALLPLLVPGFMRYESPALRDPDASPQPH